MLPTHHRLTRPEDFKRTIRSGRKASTPSVVIYGLAADSREVSPPSPGAVRVGVTVSKAVGGSVARHRVARRIRHAVAAHLDHLPAGSTWVIRALPGAATSPAIAQDVGYGVEQIMDRLR